MLRMIGIIGTRPMRMMFEKTVAASDSEDSFELWILRVAQSIATSPRKRSK